MQYPKYSTRREIFAHLTALQDRGQGVTRSRHLLAEKHGLSVAEIRAIEEEGIRRNWQLPELPRKPQ
jgi:hypothetical protein